MFNTNVPDTTGDLKTDYENLLDYVISLNKSLKYQLSHIDNSNTVTGSIAVNDDYLFVHISGGAFVG